jgi:UDP-N-acetylmuramate dehydrogenase
VKIPAAWLIERAGVRKGHAERTVGLSTKHPLAIVNRGAATSRDVIEFAVKVKRGVLDWCGVWLRPEPVFVGLEGDEDVEFLQKARA